MKRDLPDNVFRASVGAVIMNQHGKVLALERIDIKGAWQLSQGGMDEGEEPIDAIFREIMEETNITESMLEVVAEYPDWLTYELSKEKRSGKYGRGQVQKWFLLRFTGTDNDIDLKNIKEQEFSNWKWTTLNSLAKETVAFRKRIYKKLADGFAGFFKD